MISQIFKTESNIHVLTHNILLDRLYQKERGYKFSNGIKNEVNVLRVLVNEQLSQMI